MTWRLRYSKLGKVRFTSHRDSVTHFERALRRSGLEVAMSQGFTARPRMSFGLGLPTGAESLAEYLDLDLVDPDLDAQHLLTALTEHLPVGYAVTAAAHRQPGAVSLQEAVTACSWEITVEGIDAGGLRAATDAAMACATLPLERERKGQRRTDDVRPAIETLSVVDGPTVHQPDDPRPRLHAVLATSTRGLRPTELVAVVVPHLDPLDAAARVLRTEQFIDVDGRRCPVLAPAVALQEDRS